MKLKSIEKLLKDFLRITTRDTHRLSEILADNFDLFEEQIVKILRDEYQKPKNDYKVICGCFSIILRASREYPRVEYKTFRKICPLLNKGLRDKRISVKRLAALSVLNIICNMYLEHRFCKFRSKDNKFFKFINSEIRELKRNIKSSVSLEVFYSIYPRQVDRQTVCGKSGIKEEVLVEVARSLLD